jgi:hypothetical protein
MRALVCGGAGFLLAVLWFDLMFDVQIRSETAEALTSIAAYYRRVTTEAFPMNRLVASAMLVTLGAIVGELVQGDGWAAWISLVLAAVPIALAGVRTVPAAVRLGAREDPIPAQRVAAHRILTEHAFCLACIVALLVVQGVGLM